MSSLLDRLLLAIIVALGPALALPAHIDLETRRGPMADHSGNLRRTWQTGDFVILAHTTHQGAAG